MRTPEERAAFTRMLQEEEEVLMNNLHGSAVVVEHDAVSANALREARMRLVRNFVETYALLGHPELARLPEFVEYDREGNIHMEWTIVVPK